MVHVFIIVLVAGQVASRALLPLGVKVAPAGVLPIAAHGKAGIPDM
jgi:hypothetical protein